MGTLPGGDAEFVGTLAFQALAVIVVVVLLVFDLVIADASWRARDLKERIHQFMADRAERTRRRTPGP